MKRITWIAIGVAAMVLAVLSVASAAQRGQGRGVGLCICPYGMNVPLGPGGGWWTRAQPTTPEQKAFVEQVAQMHQAIRQARLELAQLTDPLQREAKQAEIAALQTKVHDLQLKNVDLMRQMMGNGAPRGAGQRWGRGGNGFGRGRGARGMGRGIGPGCMGGGRGVCPFAP